MTITLLTEKDLRRCVGMDHAAMQAVAGGFTALAEGRVSLPPIMRIDIPEHNGEVDVKTAYIPGLDFFAIKVASGFLDNPALGLPYGSGMMVLMSARTGFLEALLLDNGYLTDLRTGLAGAIVAHHLAPQRIEAAGVIGSGVQARYQVRGLNLVRDFHRLLVFGVEIEQVEAYAQEMTTELDISVEVCQSPEEVVRQSQFVVTTTPSRQPYLKAEWLHPHLHITAMGSDAEHKQELEAQALGRADLLACDSKAQCFRLGELHHALEKGVITQETVITELGELTSGRKPGRADDQQITICDLTGVGVQDTAIAVLTYQRARELGFGVSLEV